MSQINQPWDEVLKFHEDLAVEMIALASADEFDSDALTRAANKATHPALLASYLAVAAAEGYGVLTAGVGNVRAERGD